MAQAFGDAPNQIHIAALDCLDRLGPTKKIIGLIQPSSDECRFHRGGQGFA